MDFQSEDQSKQSLQEIFLKKKRHLSKKLNKKKKKKKKQVQTKEQLIQKRKEMMKYKGKRKDQQVKNDIIEIQTKGFGQARGKSKTKSNEPNPQLLERLTKGRVLWGVLHQKI